MKNPAATLNPAATPEQLAAYWASLSKRERMALLRRGQAAAMPSSAARQSAVAATKDAAARKV